MATEHRIESCPECGNTGKLEIISLSKKSILDCDDFWAFFFLKQI